jgi:hypothetical protein
VEAEAQAAEPERWQGAVGGGIQFRRKAKPAASNGEAADVDMAGEAAAGSTRGAATSSTARAVPLTALMADDDREGLEQGGEDTEGQPESSAGLGEARPGEARPGEARPEADADMQDAAAGAPGASSQGPQFKPPRAARSGRGYRSKAAAGED